MMPKVTIDQMYRLTGEIFDKAADTIFISCTGLGIFDLIEMVESDFQRTVLTSNQVTLWMTLRTLQRYMTPSSSRVEVFRLVSCCVYIAFCFENGRGNGG
jgi:maleate isomerase